MAGRLWTDEERLAAFALYLRMPTNLISYEENPEIVKLAKAMGRTPGSIALKLQNFLAYDPNATRAGFRNASRVDYAERGDEFVKDCIEAYRAVMPRDTTSSGQELVIEYETREGRDILTTSTRRLNQDYFRKSLLEVYDYRCCVTGLNAQPFLVASHIKRWKDSDPITERTNVENGLLLNALHDKAFDRGLITVNDDYEIVISKELRRMRASDSSGIVRWLCDPARCRIRLPKTHIPRREFLEYHRDVVFLG